MGLADRADQPPPADPRVGCAVGRLLATLDDDERAGFDRLRDALNDRALADVVTEEGYRSPRDGRKIKPQTFAKHRRRGCGCVDAGLA